MSLQRLPRRRDNVIIDGTTTTEQTRQNKSSILVVLFINPSQHVKYFGAFLGLMIPFLLSLSTSITITRRNTWNEALSELQPHLQQRQQKHSFIEEEEICSSFEHDKKNDFPNISLDISYDNLYYPPPNCKLIKSKGRKTVALNCYSDTKLSLKPTHGQHQCHNNAIFSFAYGYQIQHLIHFVTTLIQSGYSGDLVLGMNTQLTSETKEYLASLTSASAQRNPKINVILYEIPLTCKKKYPICQSHYIMYMNTTSNKYIKDIRPERRVAVVRFEYYYLWSTLYSPTSQILLTDLRDVYFQINPIPTTKVKNNDVSNTLSGQQQPQSKSSSSSSSISSTTLVVFEEAGIISQSVANSNWIRRTYGQETFTKLHALPIICSGTVYGGKLAIETYTKAMVNTFDQTECSNCERMHDQCFHNYLIHLNLLLGANDNTITNIIQYKQGDTSALVNTVGLISKRNNGLSLRQLGLIQGNETMDILNNDQSTLSPVIHMHDRDPEMREYINQKIQNELYQWNRTRNAWDV